MKIISYGDCYVQKNDLECIIYTDNTLHSKILSKIMTLINELRDNEYTKITDEDILQYILRYDKVPSYDELNNKSLSELQKMVFKLEINISDSDYYDDIEDTIDYQKEKNYKFYLLNQINQILSKKYNMSNNTFPNIIDPDFKPITNEVLSASKSMAYGKVLVYDNEGKILEDLDYDFCEIAYKMIMRHNNNLLEDEELSFILSDDKKYITVEAIKKKLEDKPLRRRKKIRK